MLNSRLRRTLAVFLVVLGGVLMLLAAEVWAGVVLLVAGVVLELVGIALERQSGGREATKR
jgi:Zn-dependent membrane protease YugP